MTILACDLSAASELVARLLQIIDADGSHVANGTSRYRRTIQWKRQRPLNLAKPSNVTQAIVLDGKDINVLSLTNLCSLFSYRLQNGRDIAWGGPRILSNYSAWGCPHRGQSSRNGLSNGSGRAHVLDPHRDANSRRRQRHRCHRGCLSCGLVVVSRIPGADRQQSDRSKPSDYGQC